MSNTLKLGNGKWATGKDTVLGYNSENNNIKPLAFSFSRASSGTVVNKDGLIETVGSGEPRIDFKDNTKGALLLEPSRSNLIQYSEDFSNAYWTKSGSSVTSGFISPDGTANAFKLVEGTNTGEHRVYSSYTATTINVTHTFSQYVKKGEIDIINLQEIASSGAGGTFDLTNKTAVAIQGNASSTITVVATIEELANDWFKCSFTFESNIGGSFVYATYLIDTGVTSYTGDGTSGVYIWGAQLEQGSYATSYIPTSGQANGVTRVADSSSQTVPDGVIGQTEGTVFVDVDFETLSGINMFVSIRPDASNKIEIYRSDAIIYGEFASTNSFNFNKTNVTVGRYKIAVAYSSGSSAMYINGVLIGSNTTSFAFTSTLDGIFINSRGTSFIEQSNYNDIKLYNTRLTDQELIALTS